MTDSIVAELETGSAPWVKTWKGTSLLPRNAITKRPYSGINIPICWHTARAKGYTEQLWLTYKQAQEAGYQVKKGEKAAQVVYTSTYTKEVEAEDKTLRFLKVFHVFNIQQIEGYTAEEPAQPADRIAHADDVVRATSATIRHGGDMAAYIPSLDIITMPKIEDFRGTEHYYATLMHELTHWSAPRVKRDLKGRFGSKEYAAEELVAELGAAFLCAHLNITGDLRHASYIASWIQLLKDDPRAIFTASSQAQKAVDFILDTKH